MTSLEIALTQHVGSQVVYQHTLLVMGTVELLAV